jgi:hypothetical protein
MRQERQGLKALPYNDVKRRRQNVQGLKALPYEVSRRSLASVIVRF